jgi:hypothetical protein
MIPIAVNPNKDWFEFLLDLNLLDSHLAAPTDGQASPGKFTYQKLYESFIA